MWARPLGLLIAAALTLVPLRLSAQESPPPAPVATATPDIFLVPELLQRADETVARLRAMEAGAQTSEGIEEIRRRLPDNNADIAALLAHMRGIPVEGQTLRDLVDWEQRWVRQQEQMTAWTTTLGQRVAGLDAQLAEVQALERRWIGTRTAAVADGVPEAMRQRIEAVLAALTKTRSRLRDARTDALLLQAAVAEQVAVVTDQIAAIEQQEAQLRERLFKAETEPIWQSVTHLFRDAPPAVVMQALIRQSTADIATYIRQRPGSIALQLGIFAGFVALGLYLRARARDRVVVANSNAAVDKLLGRPVSAGMVLALVATNISRIDSPIAVQTMLRAMIVVPFYRMLQIGVFADLPGALSAIAVIFAFGTVEMLLPPATPLARLLNLGECVVFGVWIWWLMKPAHLARVRVSERWRGIIRLAGRLTVGSLAVAAVANVFGNVVLASLLTRGTTTAIVGGLAVQVVLVAIEGFFEIFADSTFGRSIVVLQEHRPVVRQRVLWLVRLILTGVWITGTLHAFAMLGPTFSFIRRTLDAQLSIGSLSVTLGGIVALVVTIWLSFALSHLLRFILEEGVLPRLSLPRGVPSAISVSASYAVLLLGFLAALSAAGVDFGRITVLLGAFGVGISFGLQTIVHNFVSGLILLFERPIQVGDTIEIAGVKGVVRNIGIRASKLRTADGAEVIVPNGTLLSDQVTNWTFSHKERQVIVRVSVARGADPQAVIALLIEAAKKNPIISEAPAPNALFANFGDNRIDFTVEAWAQRITDVARLRSELGVAVDAALRDAGIPLPPPIRPETSPA